MTRQRLHEILARSHGDDRTGRAVDIALIILIVANVIAVMLETSPAVYEGRETFFLAFEVISVAIFTVEYLLRLWVAPQGALDRSPWSARLRYIVSPAALIDLIAIAPFYLAAFIGFDLRFLRILRLMRLLKLTRYSSALTMLMEVIRRESGSFLACFFILGVLLIAAASGAYIAERQAQPENFGSIPAAMWWAVVTLTTVGYGDVIPITALGRFFGAVIAVIGIGIAALPAGIIASGLSSELSKRRQRLREEFLRSLGDGRLDAADEERLEHLRRELGLSRSEAKDVRHLSQQIRNPARFCPHCGKELNLTEDSPLGGP
ncbi:MAG: ion transporter [Pseudomonadota bacterium]